MFRRLLGLIILIVAVLTTAVMVAGAVYAQQAVDGFGSALDNSLALTNTSLETVSATLVQTKATVTEAGNAMTTAEETTTNLAQTIEETRPLVAGISSVITETAPDNIEAVQQAIPNVAAVAGVVDDTLTRLSSFGISRTIPIPFNPITIDFDLGIDYEPEEPFDVTLIEMGDSLEGLPQQLRLLQSDLEISNQNLGILAENLDTAATDIEAINEQITLFIPILDQYLAIVEEITGSIAQIQAQMDAQLETVKMGLTIMFVFLALTQLAPLYLGWELLSGQRSRIEVVAATPSTEGAETKPVEQTPGEADDLAESAADESAAEMDEQDDKMGDALDGDRVEDTGSPATESDEQTMLDAAPSTEDEEGVEGVEDAETQGEEGDNPAQA